MADKKKSDKKKDKEKAKEKAKLKAKKEKEQKKKRKAALKAKDDKKKKAESKKKKDKKTTGKKSKASKKPKTGDINVLIDGFSTLTADAPDSEAVSRAKAKSKKERQKAGQKDAESKTAGSEIEAETKTDTGSKTPAAIVPEPGVIKYYAIPRTSDLDTQRHVTSRTYESFCWEARLSALADAGFSIERMLDENVRLTPTSSHVRFKREQMPGNQLTVCTEIFAAGKGEHIWRQIVRETETGNEACRLYTKTMLTKAGDAMELELPLAQAELTADELELLAPAPAFTGTCDRVKSPYVGSFSERTVFFDYPPTALWRIMEEGRWQFSDHIGLDEKLIHDIDTITFFTSGTYQFNKMPKPGQEFTIFTWVEKLDKIRCFMRQEVTAKGDESDVLFSIREEQLIVSLAKRRPKRAPEEFKKLVAAFTEQTEEAEPKKEASVNSNKSA